MKTKIISTILLVLLTTIGFSQNLTVDELKTTNGVLKIQPITHGSLILYHSNKTIYVDPYGGFKLYKDLKSPDIILITDIHGDHLDFKTLDSIDTSKTIFIVPQEVSLKMPKKYKAKTTILNNGQGLHRLDFFIKAIPMYNLPENPPTSLILAVPLTTASVILSFTDHCSKWSVYCTDPLVRLSPTPNDRLSLGRSPLISNVLDWSE